MPKEERDHQDKREEKDKKEDKDKTEEKPEVEKEEEEDQKEDDPFILIHIIQNEYLYINAIYSLFILLLFSIQ